ncbi:MAG: cysteine desulfurase family protein, partial [Sulfobacillus sp.]
MMRIADIPVYLDYNATTPVAAEVVAAMAPYWTELYHNPSSPYPEAAHVRAAVEDARAATAALLCAESDTIVFTSGGTESDHWALEAGVAFWRGTRRKVIASAVEHPAVTETLLRLESQGAEVMRVPTDEHGVIRLDILDQWLDSSTAVVSVMLANNEVGTRQPVAEVARLAHAVGALVHTDAAQAVGKISVDVRALDVDLLTVAGHKFYAPKGIGALYIRRGLDLPTGLPGGGQEGGRRSGTENVPAIVGLGEAARLAAIWLAGEGPRRQ